MGAEFIVVNGYPWTAGEIDEVCRAGIRLADEAADARKERNRLAACVQELESMLATAHECASSAQDLCLKVARERDAALTRAAEVEAENRRLQDHGSYVKRVEELRAAQARIAELEAAASVPAAITGLQREVERLRAALTTAAGHLDVAAVQFGALRREDAHARYTARAADARAALQSVPPAQAEGDSMPAAELALGLVAAREKGRADKAEAEVERLRAARIDVLSEALCIVALGGREALLAVIQTERAALQPAPAQSECTCPLPRKSCPDCGRQCGACINAMVDDACGNPAAPAQTEAPAWRKRNDTPAMGEVVELAPHPLFVGSETAPWRLARVTLTGLHGFTAATEDGKEHTGRYCDPWWRWPVPAHAGAPCRLCSGGVTTDDSGLPCERCGRAGVETAPTQAARCGPCEDGECCVHAPDYSGTPLEMCLTCCHPRAWHEHDPDTGEGPLECSPPGLSVCPCMDFAAPGPKEAQGAAGGGEPCGACGGKGYRWDGKTKCFPCNGAGKRGAGGACTCSVSMAGSKGPHAAWCAACEPAPGPKEAPKEGDAVEVASLAEFRPARVVKLHTLDGRLYFTAEAPSGYEYQDKFGVEAEGRSWRWPATSPKAGGGER